MGELEFEQVLGGLFVVGIGVDVLSRRNPAAAYTLVWLILLSMVLLTPGSVEKFAARLAELRAYLFHARAQIGKKL